MMLASSTTTMTTTTTTDLHTQFHSNTQKLTPAFGRPNQQPVLAGFAATLPSSSLPKAQFSNQFHPPQQTANPLREIRVVLGEAFSCPATCDLLTEALTNKSIFTEHGHQLLSQIVQKCLTTAPGSTNIDPRLLSSLANVNLSNLLTIAESTSPQQLQPQAPTSNNPPLTNEQQRLTKLLDELLLFHNFLHPSSQKIPTHSWAVALVSAILSEVTSLPCMLHIVSDSASHTRYHLILACLKNLLAPPTQPHTANDISLASIKMLAQALPEGMKVPAAVVHAVVRPALSQLCSATNMTKSFADGLLNVIELIPPLFNNTFLAKVLSILEFMVNPQHALFNQFDKIPIAGAMIQYFAALATTLDCSQYLKPLCNVVLAFKVHDDVFSPLHNLLALLPSQAAAALSDPTIRPILERVAAVSPNGSVMTEFRSLHSYFMSHGADGTLSSLSSFFMNPSFADTILVVGGMRIPAHKVVLTRCAFFSSLFASGFAESSQAEISLEEFDPQALLVALRHIYDLPIQFHDLDTNLTFLTMQIADFMQLPDLKAQSESHLARALLTKQPDEVVTQLEFLKGLEDWASAELVQALRDRVLKSRSFLGSLPHSTLVRTVLCKRGALVG